jgi:hypothetical protein
MHGDGSIVIFPTPARTPKTQPMRVFARIGPGVVDGQRMLPRSEQRATG